LVARVQLEIVNFRSPVWLRVAGALIAINVGGVAMAAQQTQPVHALVHAVLAAALAAWAQRLRLPRRSSDERVAEPRLELLEAEVSHLQGELSETLQRLEFAEKMMTQKIEAKHSGQPE
jgi:hypothetical protein